MSDRNTTIVTDRGAGPGIILGILLGVIIVLGFLIFAFGWPISVTNRSGPTIKIEVPAAPAPPKLPAPAPAPAPNP